MRNVVFGDLRKREGQSLGVIKRTTEGQLHYVIELKENVNPNDGRERRSWLEGVQRKLEPPLETMENGEIPEDWQDILYDSTVELNVGDKTWYEMWRFVKGDYDGRYEGLDSIEAFEKDLFSRVRGNLKKWRKGKKGGKILSDHKPLSNAELLHDFAYLFSEEYLSDKDLDREEIVEELYSGPIEGTERILNERKRPIRKVMIEEAEEAIGRDYPCYANVTLNSISHLLSNLEVPKIKRGELQEDVSYIA